MNEPDDRLTEQAPRLFGTDGVRGLAGKPPLNPATIRRLGAALVRAMPGGDALRGDTQRNSAGVPSAILPAILPRILIGRDTRESGPWIEAELAHGALGEGAQITSAGVVPTPAIAYLTRSQGYDAGVVISASHNPFEDNGIKVFSGRGEKFSENVERLVEAIVADSAWTAKDGIPTPVPQTDLVDAYLDHLRAVIPEPSLVEKFRLAIDCANGAMTDVAPRFFERLGCETIVTANQPDGRNINLDCGSTHPQHLSRVVVERGCQLGVAFDGDGDRAIFVDHRGRVVNGDAVLLLCARQLQREGRLANDTVVATVMSNIGLELALGASKIALVRTAVGDKYVMEEMARRGLSLGGEQSGHVIFSDYLFTGDGLCTALNVLRTVALSGRSLAELASDLVSYPQVLLNVRVHEKLALETIPEIAKVIARVENRLDGHGRLLIRYSGTEPLLRVMLEGRDEPEIRAWGQEIVDAVRTHFGI